MPKFNEWLFGKAPSIKQKPTGTPEQQKFNQNLISYLGSMMNGGGGQSLANDWYNQFLQPGGNNGQAYQQWSQPFMQQFEQQVIPGIAERFAGNGALSSSGFGQALGGATSDFQSQLAQLFSSLQSQAAGAQYGQFNNLSNLGLNYQPYQYINQPGMEGNLIPLMNAISEGVEASQYHFM